MSEIIPSGSGSLYSEVAPLHYRTNYDQPNPFRFLISCMSAEPGGDNFIGVDFRLEYYMCYEDTVLSVESGEVVSCVRSVLVTDEGLMYSFASIGIANDLRRLAAIYGDSAISPPLPARVDARPARRGKIYRLVAAPPGPVNGASRG